MQFGRGKPATGAFYDSGFVGLDSVLAISILYGMQGKNDCRVAMLSCSRPNLEVVGFVDAVERFYHGPARNFAQVVPIGMITSGKAGETPKPLVAPFDRKKPDGAPMYVNQVKTVIDTADPLTLLRNYLEAQSDQNAFMVLAGPATNLAAALDFRGMKDLLAAKIKYLVVAFGAFASDIDPLPDEQSPATKKLFAEWPTPIVAVGREIGTEISLPGASLDSEFAANTPDSPVTDAFRAWGKPDVRGQAIAAALYAGRPNAGYFKLSEPGTVTFEGTRSTFKPSAQGKHKYLIFDPAQKDKIIHDCVELATAKPVIQIRFRPNADQKKAAEKAEPQKP